MSDSTLTFAYGSNLDVAQMAARCPDAKVVSVARLGDHRLAFTRWSPAWAGGVADVVASPGRIVWGLLWSMPLADLDALDRYEGHPANYRRTRKSVTSDEDAPVDAWVYEVVDKRVFVAPAKDYVEVLLRAATMHGFPIAYVDDIRTAASGTDEE